MTDLKGSIGSSSPAVHTKFTVLSHRHRTELGGWWLGFSMQMRIWKKYGKEQSRLFKASALLCHPHLMALHDSAKTIQLHGYALRLIRFPRLSLSLSPRGDTPLKVISPNIINLDERPGQLHRYCWLKSITHSLHRGVLNLHPWGRDRMMNLQW